MPELPEVETVRRGLAPALEGARIERADVNRPDLRRPFPPDMAGRLAGARVERLARRSKYLIAELSTGEALLVHLGMSGRMLVSGVPDMGGAEAGEEARKAAQMPGQFVHAHPAPQKHDHVVFHIEGGARVTFNDPRRFGLMDMCATAALGAHPLLAGLGPEPLGNGFHAGVLRAAFAGRKTPVKAALLDQRVVAGLGNIYVCEALHRAGISPLRAAGRISARRIEALAGAVRAVLHEAIEAGGSSLRDHRQASGELGYFQHAFRVYGRAGAPCPSAGCAGTVQRVVQAGRSSFHCPRCQR